MWVTGRQSGCEQVRLCGCKQCGQRCQGMEDGRCGGVVYVSCVQSVSSRCRCVSMVGQWETTLTTQVVVPAPPPTPPARFPHSPPPSPPCASVNHTCQVALLPPKTCLPSPPPSPSMTLTCQLGMKQANLRNSWYDIVSETSLPSTSMTCKSQMQGRGKGQQKRGGARELSRKSR